MDDRQLMEIRADTLFRYDTHRRMVCNNELDAGPAPSLFVGRTTSGHTIRFGHAIPDTSARSVTEIVERQPPHAALRVPNALLTLVREALHITRLPRGKEAARPTGSPSRFHHQPAWFDSPLPTSRWYARRTHG